MTPERRRPVRWLHVLGFGRPRPDESAELEIEHHIAELTDRLVAEGMTAEEARREAERHFGNRARFAAKMRSLEEASLRGDAIARLGDFVRRSVVSVVRTARREPGFTAAVVLTLGLGIGANTTMYGILDRLLLRGPEHVVEPDRVVRVYVDRLQGRPAELSLTASVAYADYVDLRAHSGFAAVASYLPQGEVTVGSGVTAERVVAVRTSPEYFSLLGAAPHFGRFYTSDETRRDASPVVVLGFEYWRDAYSADPGVLGRSIELDGEPYTIIGVAPRSFTGVDLHRVDVWLSLEQFAPLSGSNGCLTDRSCYGLQAVARLATNETMAAAEEQATALHLNGRRELIAEGRYSDRSRIVLRPLIAARGPDASAESRVALWLAGVSIIVLLIACANIASLLLARATKQRSETAIRLALGGSRWEIIAQVIVQSVVLASVGGFVALALARWGGEVVRATLLPEVLFPDSALTPRAVAFTIAAAAVAGVSAAILPAIQMGMSQHVALRPAGLGASPRRSRSRGVLTALQSGMTAALLVSAGLFARSLDRLGSLDLGLDVDRLVLVTFEYRDRYPDTPRSLEITAEAMARVDALPSVLSSAATSAGLGVNVFARIFVRNTAGDSIAATPGGGPWFHVVTPGFFETVGLEVRRGRGIEESDREDGEKVAVVNETMANMLWPEANPIGECLVERSAAGCSYRVVGVVDDAARSSYLEPPAPAFYVPSTQAPRSLGVHALYVRTNSHTDDVARDIAAVLRGFSPDVRYVRAIALRDHLAPQARSWTLGATLFTLFGTLALAVAAVGLYSVLAYDVAQRTRDIGIRMALGARKARVLRSVVAQGASLGALGLCAGLAVAYLAAPYIQDLLFETSPRDPVVFATVAFVLLAVSVGASWIPALRATRVDPITALKAD